MSDITSSFPLTLLEVQVVPFCRHCDLYIPFKTNGGHKDDCPLNGVILTRVAVDSHGYLKVEFEKTKGPECK